MKVFVAHSHVVTRSATTPHFSYLYPLVIYIIYSFQLFFSFIFYQSQLLLLVVQSSIQSHSAITLSLPRHLIEKFLAIDLDSYSWSCNANFATQSILGGGGGEGEGSLLWLIVFPVILYLACAINETQIP